MNENKGYVLIVGAKSDIAQALAREYAENGYYLYLAARGDKKELEGIASDIKIRYNVKTECCFLDILDFASHQKFYEQLNPKPIGVVVAVGYLGDQKEAQNSFDETHCIIDTNYTGCVSLLNIVANDLEKRKEGFIVGISSVAGERGRKNNYLYGSAKAALSAYLSGLRQRLFKAGVQVLTVKPGFVNTKMTKRMDLPKKLTAQPEEVAADILRAQQKGRDIICSKRLWRYIMFFIKLMPEKYFKRANF